MSPWPSATRRPAAVIAAAALALSACSGGQEPLTGPAADPPQRAPVPAGDIGAEPAPHAPAQMPAEGLDPDGRLAPWAMGAQVGATLYALAEACGRHGQAQLRDMRDAQRRSMAGQGVDAGRFDAVWTWAYRQAREKIAMQPPAELARGCESLREMEQEADRMPLMQQMAPPPPGG